MATNERKSVEVVMPEIKLALADLAYLTTLGSGQTCYPANKVKDKLIFLGLIEMGDIKPCPDAVKKHAEQTPDLLATVRSNFKEKKWPALSNSANTLHYHFKNKPVITKGMILTQAGRDIVSKGRAVSNTASKGCL